MLLGAFSRSCYYKFLNFEQCLTLSKQILKHAIAIYQSLQTFFLINIRSYLGKQTKKNIWHDSNYAQKICCTQYITFYCGARYINFVLPTKYVLTCVKRGDGRSTHTYIWFIYHGNLSIILLKNLRCPTKYFKEFSE